jgi:hypothetical protein
MSKVRNILEDLVNNVNPEASAYYNVQVTDAEVEIIKHFIYVLENSDPSDIRSVLISKLYELEAI